MLTKLNNKITNIIAGCLLLLMLFLAFFSMLGDSATMDELAHIPAGYSYITQKDMRLNPEHPPLLKDLAGLSAWLGEKLTDTPINFPFQIKAWQKDINGQWDFGGYFFYQAGNNADKIIFWARLPMLLIMLILGFYVFKWTRELYGNTAGLLALFLYSLSPNFLAHGRYVTTDVGAAAAFFIAAYYFLKWLKNSNKKNLIVAGLVFGLAMLIKFSLVLLIPYFVFLAAVWSLTAKNPKGAFFGNMEIFKDLIKPLSRLLLIGLIGLALIWPVYEYHVFNYPEEKQRADAEFILQSFGSRALTNSIIFMADKPMLRPYGQYFLGLLMVMQRAVGGNTTYFLGEVSAAGWKYYFPIVFLIKVPLALIILILTSFILAVLKIKKPLFQKPLKRTFQWIRSHFTEFALLSFLALYWITTLRSNLNIGVRHILPTFPVLYVLISGQIIKILNSEQRTMNGKKIKLSVIHLPIIAVMLWYGFAAIKTYPHFLAYFNELVNGSKNGYQYVTDSNLDWGQDLKRLAQFVDSPAGESPAGEKINEIYLDYFGGGSAGYYLKEKYEPWWGNRDPKELPLNSWLAVSATLLQGGRGRPAPGFESPTGYYNWLNQYEPIAIIGHSIFVYQIE